MRYRCHLMGANAMLRAMSNEVLLRLVTSLPIFLLAIVFHEYAHAWMAKRFGDDTADREGRLTFNPMSHMDPLGTLIFPLMSVLIGGVMFGWARPVPVDPRYFKNIRTGVFWVSFAGPLANIILAIFCAFGLAFIDTQLSGSGGVSGPLRMMFQQGLMINLILAVFNLIPFPPLDGSKMVSTFLDYEKARKFEELGRYSFVFIILLWTTNIFSYLMIPVNIFMGIILQAFYGILG